MVTISQDLDGRVRPRLPASAITYDSYSLGPAAPKGCPAQSPVVFVNQTASGLQVTMYAAATTRAWTRSGPES